MSAIIEPIEDLNILARPEAGKKFVFLGSDGVLKEIDSDGVIVDLLLTKMAKFTKHFTDWKPNATTTGAIDLGLLPAGTVCTAFKIKTSVAFAGVSSATLTLYDASGNQLGGGNSLLSVGPTVSMAGPINNGIFDHAAPSAIRGRINVGKADTIDDLTIGTVDIWVWYYLSA